MAAILLTGDVMLGRGIDQILQQPSSPEIYETCCQSALDYVALAEAISGPIPRSVACDYVWGDALDAFRRADLRIINLETAITCCEEAAPKGINYRCHPANLPCLAEASVDCCALANNHVLDWGEEGLIETLSALETAGLRYAGAGRSLDEARSGAVLPIAKNARALVYAIGASSSGIPESWAAAPRRAGVSFLDDEDRALEWIAGRVAHGKEAGDVAIVSIHWGPNWGYDIPDEDRRFAHRLIDEAGADIVHGHSSHHPKAIEIWSGRPILYGCGDFLNDYEGIGGHEAYRSNLALACLISTEGFEVELIPFRIERFRLNHPTREQAEWLAATLDRECGRFGGQVTLEPAAEPEVFVLRVS